MQIDYVTYFVCVAENNSVCLCGGKFWTMALRDFANPSSNILSASSKTEEE